MGINKKPTWSIQSRPAIYSGMAIPKFKNTQGAGAGKLLISHLHKHQGREISRWLKNCILY
jgi:hypothetical protein